MVYVHSGLDPLLFSGFCGAASAMVGFVLGGTIFNATWQILSRDKARQYSQVHFYHALMLAFFIPIHYTYVDSSNLIHFQREADFLKRLEKHRYSEVSKYEDDYYGERVRTLSDYRQWVRQQQKRRIDMAKLKQSEAANS